LGRTACVGRVVSCALLGTHFCTRARTSTPTSAARQPSSPPPPPTPHTPKKYAPPQDPGLWMLKNNKQRGTGLRLVPTADAFRACFETTTRPGMEGVLLYRWYLAQRWARRAAAGAAVGARVSCVRAKLECVVCVYCLCGSKLVCVYMCVSVWRACVCACGPAGACACACMPLHLLAQHRLLAGAWCDGVACEHALHVTREARATCPWIASASTSTMGGWCAPPPLAAPRPQPAATSPTRCSSTAGSLACGCGRSCPARRRCAPTSTKTASRCSARSPTGQRV
jgi:hypothetical protein